MAWGWDDGFITTRLLRWGSDRNVNTRCHPLLDLSLTLKFPFSFIFILF